MCDSPNHLACDCHSHKTESKVKKTGAQEKKDNKIIRTWSYSDNGRESRCVEAKIEGIPVTGLIDTGSYITIVRGDLLSHIVSTAGLEASKIRSAGQMACTYDQKPITLGGQIDLNISFGENTLCTTAEPVYNGHLGTRYIWPLYTGGCYRENLYKMVSSILVAMAIINE